MGTCGLLLVCAALGYATVALLYRGRSISWALTVGLGILLGACECGLLLFYLALAGLRPGWGALAVVAAVALVALAIAAMLGRCRWPTAPSALPYSWPSRALLLIPLALAAYALIIATLEVFRRPLLRWDAWAFWLFKAKIIANERLIPPPLFFTTPAYSYTHPHYPLLWPVLAAGVYGANFNWDDHAARLIQIPLFAALALMMYAALRSKLGRFAAGMLAALQLAVPAVLYHAGVGYADVMLAGYYGAMICCILLESQQSEGGNWATLIAAALLATGCAFTKAEGLPLAGIGALMTFLLSAKRGLAAAAARTLVFCAITLILLAPWYWWSHGFARLDEDYESRLSLAILRGNIQRLPIILRGLGQEMTDPNDWGPLWAMLPVFALLGWRGFRRRYIRVLWLALAAQFCIYVFAYTITRDDLTWLLQNTTDRLLIHLTPVAILLIGFHWQSMSERDAPAAQPSPLG